MKVIIYNRKSTKDKEDQQVLSIKGQQEENKKRAEHEGYEVVAEYDEERSAKQPGRNFFNEMLTLIEDGKADAIVCWRLNRLARNPIDGGRIQWLLQQGIIKAIITSDKIYLPSDNVIQMSVEFGMATQFSLDLAKDVKRGMLQKAKDGWRPSTAPFAYLNDYGGIKGEKQIYKDPERFDKARECWDLLLTKAYTVKQIHAIALEEWKLTVRIGRKGKVRPIALNTLYNMFTNPFYYGEFEWDRKMWKGAHKPMITEEEFDLAQIILGDRGRPRNHQHKNPYPGLIKCGKCGRMIVFEVKEKFIKSENCSRIYNYFRCSRNCDKGSRLPEEELNRQLYAFIEQIRIPQSFIDWGLKQLKMSQSDKKKRREKELKSLNKGHSDIEKKIDALIDMRLVSPNALTQDTFDRKMQSLEKELKNCKQHIDDYGSATKTWRDELISSLIFLEKLCERYAGASCKERLIMLHRIGQSLELENKVVSLCLTEPFSTLAKGKERMEAAIRPLGLIKTLDKPLNSLKKPVLNQVISEWSHLGDSNPGPTHYK